MKMRIPGLLIVVSLLSLTGLYAQKENITVNQLVIIANDPGPVISKDIYGHFSEHLGGCIYGGIWVGRDSRIPNTDGIRNDVIAALKEMKIPVLRWPGGCFADTYHWKDGIGPQAGRASIINTNWGGVTENNSFGTHEFMKLTELIGCDAYITGNVGSGTVREMAEWVEYITSGAESPMTKIRKDNGRKLPWKVKYWGIGNETWGCGGSMTAEYYSNIMRQYSTYLRDFPGNSLYRITCGASDNNYGWTETLMKDPDTRGMFQGISLHYYSVPGGWDSKNSATRFSEADWFETFRLNFQMDNLITGHSAIMDRYDPEKRIGLVVDEWGNWFRVEPGTNPSFLYQQNTMRDAITAAIHLNIFNQHADRVKVANIAQTVNVLQAVILTHEDRMVLTPTYHVFRMFSVHQEARLLRTGLKCEDYVNGTNHIPSVSASASIDKEGKVHISLANLNPSKSITIDIPVIGDTFGNAKGEILTAPEMNALNSFDKPDYVRPAAFTGFTLRQGGLTVTLPSKSVVVLELTK